MTFMEAAFLTSMAVFALVTGVVAVVCSCEGLDRGLRADYERVRAKTFAFMRTPDGKR